MGKNWTDVETDGRTLKGIITTLKRRFKKLDKDDTSDIDHVIHTADALARIIKVKHDLIKTHDIDVRLREVEKAAALTKKHKTLLMQYK